MNSYDPPKRFKQTGDTPKCCLGIIDSAINSTTSPWSSRKRKRHVQRATDRKQAEELRRAWVGL